MILFFYTPIQSNQASVPVQRVLATDQSKLLSYTVATWNTIDTHPSNNFLKVLFDSGSTKTMINC